MGKKTRWEEKDNMRLSKSVDELPRENCKKEVIEKWWNVPKKKRKMMEQIDYCWSYRPQPQQIDVC